MLALISPAKTMHYGATIPTTGSQPRFMDHTNHIASLMLNYSVSELELIFKISNPIARELKLRFSNIFDDSISGLTAVDSYDGVVYKHIKREFSTEELEYLQSKIRISSLLYGVLRPLDLVKPYRMEGFVRLSGSDQAVDRYWRDIQTQTLIEDVNSSGGVLLYLASKQEQSAFHWREVKRAIRVIDIEFLQYKGDKLRQVVIYTKMARGEMIRYMVDNRIEDIQLLKSFEWSGYRYSATHSSDDKWVWVME